MPKPGEIDYLLKGIPKGIYEKAQRFAAEHRPPLAMRWLLITLLEKWVESEKAKRRATDPPTETPAPKKTAPRRKAKPVEGVAVPVRTEPQRLPDAPDLGDSF